MDILSILNDKTSKAIEKRKAIESHLIENNLPKNELTTLCDTLNEKQLGIVLEAIESVTNKNPICGQAEWLELAGRHICNTSNTIKREASRIVGNLCAQFPEHIGGFIPSLIENTNNDGTVVRWASAYALGRIITLPEFALSPLFESITTLYENETDNGVKNQYLSGIKKAQKLRK